MDPVIFLSAWYISGLVFGFATDYINLKYILKDFSGYSYEEILPKLIFAIVGPFALALLIYICLRAFAGVKNRTKKEEDE